MRPWRIIYNDDNGDTRNMPTQQEFLAARLGHLACTQVDLVVFDPFVDERIPLYPTNSPYLRRQTAIKWGVDLLDKCEDPFQYALDYCKYQLNVDFFASFRLNDAQDTQNVPDSKTLQDFVIPVSPLNPFPRWKLENPDCLLGGDYLLAILQGQAPSYDPTKLSVGDPRHWWTAKNFAKRAVRQRELAAIRDMCEHYPIDGIELDFMRGPIYFPETFSSQPAAVSDDNRAIMTEFVSDVRAMLDDIARTLGRAPFAVACRVPESLVQSKFIGLDVEVWVQKNLVDLLIAGGGYSPLSMFEPLQQMVQQISHKVPVYACISHSGLCRLLICCWTLRFSLTKPLTWPHAQCYQPIRRLKDGEPPPWTVISPALPVCTRSTCSAFPTIRPAPTRMNGTLCTAKFSEKLAIPGP